MALFYILVINSIFSLLSVISVFDQLGLRRRFSYVIWLQVIFYIFFVFLKSVWCFVCHLRLTKCHSAISNLMFCLWVNHDFGDTS